MLKIEPQTGRLAEPDDERELDRQERWNRRKQRRKTYKEEDERYLDKSGKRLRVEDKPPDWTEDVR